MTQASGGGRWSGSAQSALVPMLTRSLFLQSAWNTERRQNLGFLYALTPALRRIWREPGDRTAALRRHIEYFSTEPHFSTVCLGAAAKLEEEMAAAPKSERAAREARLRAVKASLATACAAAGTPFFETLRAFCALLAVAAWGLGATWFWWTNEEPGAAVPAAVFTAGMALALVVYNLAGAGARSGGLRLGWKHGEAAGAELKKLPLKTLEQGLRWTGFLTAAAGAAVYLFVAGSRGDIWTLVAALGVAALKVWEFSTPALYACTLFVCVAMALIA